MRSLGLVALPLAFAAAAVAGTPFGSDDTGFLPTTRSALVCGSRTQVLAAKLVTGLTLCHAKMAEAALGGTSVPDEGCEQAAVGKFLGKTSKAITSYACPACLVANLNVAPYPDDVRAAVDTANGDLFCAGTTQLGDDDAGFVPPDAATLKCETVVGKALGKLRTCLAGCHGKYAKTVMAGGTFDEEACEHTDPLHSCRAKFDRVRDKIAPSCPSCLDAVAQDDLADQAESDVEGTNGTFYCASPGGAFLDAGR